MPRLLSQVLEHLGFLEEPRIERRINCTQVLFTERSLYMPISIILQQQDQEEVADEVVEDPPRGEDHVPEMEVEVERSPVPDSSPPSPPPSAPIPADTAGPSHTSQQSLEHVHVSSRELAAIIGCCLRACYYTGVVGPAGGPSRGHSSAYSHHASSDHESPRSPARAYTDYSRPVHNSSLLGHASSRRSSFRSTGTSTTTRVKWSHSLL